MNIETSIRRVSAIAIIVMTMVCCGCDTKPAKPEYAGPATNTPISGATHARMVLSLEKHVAKYYKSIPVSISYADLDQLPKLRHFLLGLGFVYQSGSHWRFTKKALAQSSGSDSRGADFPVARGIYDYLDVAQLEVNPTGFASTDTYSVSFHVKSVPANRLGELFAASHLLVCVDHLPYRKFVWARNGVLTFTTVIMHVTDLTIPYEGRDEHELNCPETRE